MKNVIVLGAGTGGAPTEVATVKQGASLVTTATLMTERKLGGVPVLDAEDRLVDADLHVQGIVSRADLIKLFAMK